LKFDVNVMGCEFVRMEMDSPLETMPVLDTCTEESAALVQVTGGKGGRFKLPTLTELYGFLFNESFNEAHNATADVEATTRCFLELIRRDHYSSERLNTDDGYGLRFKQENPIFIHEFLYPLMQGYDSVMIDADVELGGTDQKFNIAVGRDLQRHFGKKPQFGLLLPILIGTDGVQKMSKSLHNYVGLQEDALSMYSKLQKTPDALLKAYFELLTKRSPTDIPADPRQAQRELALDIVSQFHGTEAAISASKAAQEILNTGNTSLAEAVAEYSLTGVNFPVKLFYLLSDSGLCTSSTEGKRQIQGGAVRLDGDRLTDPELSFTNPRDLQGKVLQLGKRKFVRFVI
jgi:tyrosyl-tRNA synthetase